MASTRSRSLGPVADRVFVANVRKHGVTFEEAMTVFLDELAVPFEEGAHSRRWNILLFVLTARTGAAATPFGTSSRPPNYPTRSSHQWKLGRF